MEKRRSASHSLKRSRYRRKKKYHDPSWCLVYFDTAQDLRTPRFAKMQKNCYNSSAAIPEAAQSSNFSDIVKQEIQLRSSSSDL